MSVRPESIRIDQCYLTDMGTVRRVTGLLPGRAQYQQRAAHRPTWVNYKAGILELRSFALTVEWLVPCDWTPGTDA